MLYIVATPIGNLEDFTLRAIETLKEADYVLAEDTRRSGKLLSHFKIKNKLISYNDYNKEKKTPGIIEDLKKGKDIALVSDAGTPGISDPAFYLVRECRRKKIKVSPIPGPSALISALVVSGLPTDKFTFYGFFPKKKSKQEKLLSEINSRGETAVYFDSPYRIKKNMQKLSEKFPSSKVVIAREISKKFEEFITGTANEVYEEIKSREIKGEITVVLKVGKLS